MNSQERYEFELNSPYYDEEYKEELKNLSDEQIEESFYTSLKFGTAGIRGKMGPGTNRMNKYVIRKVSFAVAKWLLEMNSSPTIAIAYDSRRNSQLFALEAARTLASSGVEVHLFKDVASTPELSFAVRDLQADGGIVITASHNPKEYNGYKVYHRSGRQVLAEEAKQILTHFEAVEDLSTIPCDEFDKLLGNKIIWMAEEVTERYDKAIQDAIKEPSLKDQANTLNVVYSPLHGTGKRPVLKAFENFGITNVFPVMSQLEPDGEFTEVSVPNPEDVNVFTQLIELGDKVHADLLIATDPDCDRIGVMVLKDGDYHLINGNQMGAIMLYYLLEKGHTGEVITTVVSTLQVDAIAKAYDLPVIRTLTGFKYIGEQMNQGNSFLLGFEESYGYLNATHARDKDAVNAALLVCEMAIDAKNNGRTLLDRLEEIQGKFGYYHESQLVLTLEGKEGSEKIQSILEKFRKHPIEEMDGKKCIQSIDFLYDDTGLPKENMLRYVFEDYSWIAIRPSGTEPKLKIYIGSTGDSEDESKINLDLMKQSVERMLQ